MIIVSTLLVPDFIRRCCSIIIIVFTIVIIFIIILQSRRCRIFIERILNRILDAIVVVEVVSATGISNR